MPNNIYNLLSTMAAARERTRKEREAEVRRLENEANNGSARGWLKGALQGAGTGFLVSGGNPFGALVGGLGGAALGIGTSVADRMHDNGQGFWSSLGDSVKAPMGGGTTVGDLVEAGMPLAQAIAFKSVLAQQQNATTAATPAGQRVANLQRQTSLKVNAPWANTGR